jgi:hypothetical protein
MIFGATDYTDFAWKEINWDVFREVGFSTRSVGVTLAVAFKPRTAIGSKAFRRVSDD